MQDRMDKNKIQIGAYYLGKFAQDEEHIKQVNECNIDFIIDFRPAHIYENKEALKYFEKYNIGLIVGMESVLPFWLGGWGENAGRLHQIHPIEEYKTAIDKFVDSPSIWGLDCGDEPSALDFEYYNDIVDLVRKKLPNQFAYIDLYPNYASRAYMTKEQAISQLGTKTYKEYIEEYCNKIDIDYIAFDHYVYSSKRIWQYYDNLHIVGEACRKTGRKYWITLQLTNGRENNNPNDVMSENQLRFQAYTAMAFGADVIIWACYTDGAWFTSDAIDLEGNKTEQYDKLQQVNSEIRDFSEVFMKYRNVDTHFIGDFSSEDLDKMPVQPKEKLDTGVFKNLRAEGNKALVVGQMIEKNGFKQALFICAADDPMDKNNETVNIIFNADKRDVKQISSCKNAQIVRKDDGLYCLQVKSNAGILLYY